MNKKKLKKKLRKEKREFKLSIGCLQKTIARLQEEKAQCIKTSNELYDKWTAEKEQTQLWIQRCKKLKQDLYDMKYGRKADEWCPGGPA